MAFISTGVEYALHCLLYLIPTPEGKVEANVRDLAVLQGVPVEYLAKLFTKLSKAGLVVASEGARGGFALARSAEEIRFLDVVVAVDGPKPLFECREIRTRCAVFGADAPAWATAGLCSIHEVMNKAQARMNEELARHTLASLASRVALKSPPDFGVQIANWLDQRKEQRGKSSPD